MDAAIILVVGGILSKPNDMMPFSKMNCVFLGSTLYITLYILAAWIRAETSAIEPNIQEERGTKNIKRQFWYIDRK